MTRRDLLRQTVTGLAMSPVFLAACKHSDLTAPLTPEPSQDKIKIDIHSQNYKVLENIGGSAYVVVQSRRLSMIVTRLDDLRFVSVNSTCTHAACDVDLYDAITMHMRCDCHGAAFSPEGKVLGGPAPAPLQAYPTTFDGESIITIDLT
ncbi:MAG: Rieske (2Fe-2S) protein [Ignavibacteriota bacterium]